VGKQSTNFKKNLDEAAETCTIDGESPVVKKFNEISVYPE
jgi:hypothetical protein